MTKNLSIHLLAAIIITLILHGCGGNNSDTSLPPETLKNWGTAGLIETDNTGGSYNPQIAFDGSGNAIAVWEQFDGTRYNIKANLYTAGTGWGTAELIETDDIGNNDFPQLAMDSSGNAIAVWRQSDGTRLNIMANRYTKGTGWGNAELIEADDVGDAYFHQIAIDSSGNAIAVWSRDDGTQTNIMANRYTAGLGWGTPEAIGVNNAGGSFYPQIAFDRSGNAISVWYQDDGTRPSIMANRYTMGLGWGTAELLETDDTGGAYNPQIAFDQSGNALAVWAQDDGTRFNILANRYTAGTGWGVPEMIETDNAGNALYPQISFDGLGNAIAVWQQSDGNWINIVTNRYTAGSGWSNPEFIDTNDTGNSENPQIAVDSLGNAITVWTHRNGAILNIMANRYITGSGWGIAEIIQIDFANPAYDPQIAFDEAGNAISVWYQYQGSRADIMANRFE